MIRKPADSRKRGQRAPGSKKAERYIQPCLLASLKRKSSYGYELIQEISRFGFIQGQAPPGMIYRHLRDMEDNGWVVSKWQTDESGPAKRVYDLTDEGARVLDYWVDFMARQADSLLRFIEMYKELKDTQG
jgi:poly-beta-hydroxybutyrate-responsive repressor